jgi:hypothetical protein
MDRTRREVIEKHLGTVARARSDDDASMIGMHFLAPPDRETIPVLIEEIEAA